MYNSLFPSREYREVYNKARHCICWIINNTPFEYNGGYNNTIMRSQNPAEMMMKEMIETSLETTIESSSVNS